MTPYLPDQDCYSRGAGSALPMEVGKAMKSRAWLAFGALSVIWGSSFLWIKIAVQELGPFRLVAFRLLFGVIGLLDRKSVV